MTSRHRVVRARLRARLADRRQRIKTTFFELHCANDALLTAATGLPLSLREGMIEPDDVYELIRALHFRLRQTIQDVEAAVQDHGGAA
jgi:hypothetical protein